MFVDGFPYMKTQLINYNIIIFSPTVGFLFLLIHKC